MTDISVHVQNLYPEDLTWDLTPDAAMAYVEGGTLDVAGFTAADHYPKGFIPSGIVLALNPSGNYVPYKNAAADSTNVAVGILRASIQVIRPDGTTKSKVGGAVMKAWGVVSVSKLPIANTVTSGGFIDATGQTDLPHIHFAA